MNEPLIRILGWSLVASLGQGVLLALVLAAGLVVLRRAAPSTRYRVLCAALVLMPLVVGATSWRIANAPPATRIEAPPPLDRTFSPAHVKEHRAEHRARHHAEHPSFSIASFVPSDRAIASVMPVLVAGWALGVLLAFARLGHGVLAVRRLRRDARPAGEALAATGSRLAERLGIAPVPLLESERVDVPTVIGWRHPFVLVPASLHELPQAQLEAVIAHELAHVRRRDALENVIQVFVVSLLFFHPVAHWLSRRIRAEREQCCDDLAAATCADPLVVARALASLERLRVGTQGFALAANGGRLLPRIRRLVEGPVPLARAAGAALAGTVVVALAIVSGASVAGSRAPAAIVAGSGAAAATQPRSLPASPAARHAVLGLIDGLDDNSFDLTPNVEEALADIRAAGTLDPVVAVFADADEHRREKAAWVLGQLGDRDAFEPLVEVLHHDASPRVRHTAAWALGTLGEERAVGHLTESLRSPVEPERAGATWALGAIGNRQAVRSLNIALRDPSANVRRTAAWWLAKVGDHSSIRPLEELRNDSSPYVREWVGTALVEIRRRVGSRE